MPINLFKEQGRGVKKPNDKKDKKKAPKKPAAAKKTPAVVDIQFDNVARELTYDEDEHIHSFQRDYPPTWLQIQRVYEAHTTETNKLINLHSYINACVDFYGNHDSNWLQMVDKAITAERVRDLFNNNNVLIPRKTHDVADKVHDRFVRKRYFLKCILILRNVVPMFLISEFIQGMTDTKKTVDMVLNELKRRHEDEYKHVDVFKKKRIPKKYIHPVLKKPTPVIEYTRAQLPKRKVAIYSLPALKHYNSQQLKELMQINGLPVTRGMTDTAMKIQLISIMKLPDDAATTAPTTGSTTAPTRARIQPSTKRKSTELMPHCEAVLRTAPWLIREAYYVCVGMGVLEGHPNSNRRRIGNTEWFHVDNKWYEQECKKRRRFGEYELAYVHKRVGSPTDFHIIPETEAIYNAYINYKESPGQLGLTRRYRQSGEQQLQQPQYEQPVEESPDTIIRQLMNEMTHRVEISMPVKEMVVVPDLAPGLLTRLAAYLTHRYVNCHECNKRIITVKPLKENQKVKPLQEKRLTTFDLNGTKLDFCSDVCYDNYYGLGSSDTSSASA